VRPSLRLATVVLGLAAVVYGTASLTGGWLGTPPWWERVERDLAHEFRDRWLYRPGEEPRNNLRTGRILPVRYVTVESPRREWISISVVAAGLALAAFGAWPRRRRMPA